MRSPAPQRREVLYAALIPLDQDSALLPNAALLDVLPMALLAPLPEAAQRADLRGLAGWVSYRGHRLPALQLEALLGHDRAPPGLRGRLVVLQGVSSPEARVVLVAQSAPRRVTLSQQVLTADALAVDVGGVIAQRCRIARQPVAIPDLAVLEREAAALAARATGA